MKKVYKYKIDLSHTQSIMLPLGTLFLSVQLQLGCLTMWCLVSPQEKIESQHQIYIFGTGHEVDCPETSIYLGTVQEGNFVWHLFSPTIIKY